TRRIPASRRQRASAAGHPPAGVRPLRADRPRTPERRGVRRLRTRYGELPRLRQRTDADGAPRTGRVGSAVSAGVHLARLAGEARVLEGCALTVAPGRRRHRALATDGSLERNFVEQKILRDTILQSTDLFKVKPYFLSDEFSLVDATIAPVLWRLPHYEIDLPPQAQPIEKYAQLVFSRPAFREGLSEREQEMRL